MALEKHAVVGGCLQVFKRNGFEWDVGLHYIGEVHRPGLLSTLFDKVTRGQLKWAKMPEVYNRIAIGDRLFDYRAGSGPFKEQMKAYFPAEAAAIDRYIELVNQASRPTGALFSAGALPRCPGMHHSQCTLRSFATISTAPAILSGAPR